MQGLSEDRYWHLLLHYRPRWTGGVESEADGRDFFLADNGKVDPSAELKATLNAFFDPLPDDPEQQHPQCRFPARYAWLKERLLLDPTRLKEVYCRQLEEALGEARAKSLTLVFASAYLNSPASMYGHTFLRLDRRESTPLLDYAINFAAFPDSYSPMIYLWKGLAGGFPGRFSAMPYYVKVLEYGDLESRSLWEYDLDLTPAQLDRFLRHAWEMNNTFFDYYFFSENCSYQLLPVLEVAEPSFRMTADFSIYVLPADTLRSVLEEPGLVTRVRYRPSPAARMVERRRLLWQPEIKLVERMVKAPSAVLCEEVLALPMDRQAIVLESAADLITYRQGFDPQRSDAAKTREREIHVCRSRVATTAEIPEVQVDETPPESGHESTTVGMTFGIGKTSPFGEISWRPALQDLVADPTGYARGTQHELFATKIRFDYEPASIYLDEFQLFRIISLSPLDRWIRKPSWKLALGYRTAHELGCTGWSCGAFGVIGGMGATIGGQGSLSPMLYVLPQADIAVGPAFRGGYRVGGGLESGLLFGLHPSWRILAQASVFDYVLGDKRSVKSLSLVQSFTVRKDAEVRLSARSEYGRTEFSLGGQVYF